MTCVSEQMVIIIIKDLVKVFDNATIVHSLDGWVFATEPTSSMLWSSYRRTETLTCSVCSMHCSHLEELHSDGQEATEKTCTECGAEGLIYVEVV